MTEKIMLLFSAMRDERTPWYVKTLVALVLAYIVSPIDIIPDFIPVIGLLDEVILVPIAFAFILKLIPEVVVQEQSVKKVDEASQKKLAFIGLLLVIIVWLLFLMFVFLLHPF